MCIIPVEYIIHLQLRAGVLLRRLFLKREETLLRRCIRRQHNQGLVRVRKLTNERNLLDFVSEKVTNTLDKPKQGFQVQPDKMFGGVDIKINQQGNRLAVSSID